MDYKFAAHHEAGHALVAKVLGANIHSMGLEPTPHCIPDVDGMDNASIAAICMGGAAATMIHYGTMGPCETDITAAKVYTDDHLLALEDAIDIIKSNRGKYREYVQALLKDIKPEDISKPIPICVDTVNSVMQNGGRITKDMPEYKMEKFNQGEKI